MPIRNATITNISKQAVPIIVGKTTAAKSNTALGFYAHGQFLIQPGKQFAVEEHRVDVGQLEELRRKQLIAYTVS